MGGFFCLKLELAPQIHNFNAGSQRRASSFQGTTLDLLLLLARRRFLAYFVPSWSARVARQAQQAEV